MPVGMAGRWMKFFARGGAQAAEFARVYAGKGVGRGQLFDYVVKKKLELVTKIFYKGASSPTAPEVPFGCRVASGSLLVPDPESSIRHSGARASAREPGIHKPRLWLWIPGPALARRPGMTTRWMRAVSWNRWSRTALRHSLAGRLG